MKRALLLVLNPFTHDPRVVRQAETLTLDGWNVSVFALHERGLPTEEESPSFRLRRFNLRTRSWPKHKVIQLIKYMECLIRMTWAGINFHPTVVHANDLDCLPIGFAVARLSRAQLVYDAHELWSDPIAARNAPRWFSRVSAWLETVLARRADTVMTVCDSIAQHMARTMAIPVPTVVRNVPWRTGSTKGCLSGRFRELLNLPTEVPIILQLGMIGAGRGIETLLTAMQQVVPPAVAIVVGGEDVTYTRIGELTYLQRLRKLAQTLGVGNRVYFLPPIDPEQIPAYAADASIGVALIEGVCLSYQYALPNKLFEYVQAGLPVVASNLPEMASLIEQYGIGETFPAGNSEMLARILNDLLASPEKLAHYRNQAFAAGKELNWEKEQLRLLQVYGRFETSNRCLGAGKTD
jgi:glycosyltransferase involved in cell wall biosynthesis